MSIRENLIRLKQAIPRHVKLVAVSKTKPVEVIREAYDAGQRLFGENKAQEMIAKQPGLPDDIKWHFIGHLQTNKVKYLIPFVSMIESVDSLRLLKEINKQAGKAGRRIDCLLQFHIASEETKFGLDLDEARSLLSSESFRSMDHVRICGLMGMATFTEDENILSTEFQTLHGYFKSIKNEFFAADDAFRELSMGMSGDYEVAIREESTIVRIGTAIFGERN
jgi:PLP dependent protein